MGSEVEVLEVSRLAEAAGVKEIVRDTDDALAGSRMRRSRFREVLDLTGRSLRVQTTSRTLSYAGNARLLTGDLPGALDYYHKTTRNPRSLLTAVERRRRPLSGT